MDFNTLFSAINIINSEISKNNYINTITNLKSQIGQYITLKQARPINQAQIATVKTGIEASREQALAALGSIQDKLTHLKGIKIYEKSGLSDIFGDNAINLLYRAQTEIDKNQNGIINEINQHVQKVTQFQQLANSIPLLQNLADENKEKNEELIISFEGGVAVQNLKDLPKISKEWGYIINSFSRLTRDNNTEIKIISMEAGSLIATLALSSAIILGIIRASDKILDLFIKFIDFKRKLLEFKSLKFSMIDIEISSMEKKAKMNLPDQAKSITSELLQEYNWQENDELYNEVTKALNLAVTKLIKFQNSGGKIDSNLHSLDDGQKREIGEFKSKRVKVLKIEEEIRRLNDSKQILEIEEGNKGEEDEPENGKETENENDGIVSIEGDEEKTPKVNGKV